jgi:CheY-specific phosphatase CheX
MFTEHAEALQRALLEVTQESFFSLAEPCEMERFDEATTAVAAGADGAQARWLRAEVGFAGALSGRVAVTMPYALASDLLANFVGLMPGEAIPEDHVIDATGEFANMVCGTWLTHDCGRRRFDLQSPAVTDIEASAPAVGPTVDQFMLVNEQPVRLGLEFDAT